MADSVTLDRADGSRRKPPTVFLCYRREDTSGYARHLADTLVEGLGEESVFIDLDSLAPGEDFVQAIDAALAGCDTVLVLIGTHWLDKDKRRQRRLDDPDDFVRREVEWALSRDLKVLPVLVGGAAMPSSRELPPSLSTLARLNAFEISDRRWHYDVSALLTAIQGFPPAAVGVTREAPRHSLPTELTSLVGRDADVASVVGLLREQRLVTLTGPGGVGKTRLALRVAHTALDRFDDGCWFVDLAAITDPGLVPSAIARALGIPEGPTQSPLDSVTRILSEQTCLIVLDNCEHLEGAAAEAARTLLESCPRIRILATSREPLGVDGECISPVLPLQSTPESDDVSEAPLPPAVELLLERARLHGVHLEHDAEPARRTLSELCRRLDGMPLAIELAAARTRSLTPEELLRRLDDRFQLLVRPKPGSAAARQQTLEATIQWSYSLLAASEQATLRRLSVFRGGFDTAAAVAVCADISSELDTIDNVGALVDRCLVQVQERFGMGRCRLLESIGLFAELRLKAHDERANAKGRHASHFAALAAEIAAHLDGPDEILWMPRLGPDEANYRSALVWCFDEDGDLNRGISLARDLSRPWVNGGRLPLASAWLRRALTSASNAPPATVAELEWVFGDVLMWLDEERSVAPHLERAVTFARMTQDPALLARCLVRMINFHVSNEDIQAAAADLDEARRCAEQAGDDRITWSVLGAVAHVRFRQQDLVAAQSIAEERVDIARRLCNPRLEAAAAINLAMILGAAGETAAARRIIDDAARAADAPGCELYLQTATFFQSELALADHDHSAARTAARRAAHLAIKYQIPSKASLSFRVRALSALELDRPQEAAVLWHCGQRWWPGGFSDSDSHFSFVPDLVDLPNRLRSRIGIPAFQQAAAHAAALSRAEMLGMLAAE